MQTNENVKQDQINDDQAAAAERELIEQELEAIRREVDEAIAEALS